MNSGHFAVPTNYQAFVPGALLMAPQGREDDVDKARRRVLVVDDNHNVADSIATLVTLLGHTVERTYTGQTSIQLAQSFQPDVIFLDLVMPNMDGFEVARRLRQLKSKAKIVALTAFAQPAFIENALQGGFDEVLAKPATAEQLIAAITGQTPRASA